MACISARCRSPARKARRATSTRNFYRAQEDLIRERQARAGWSFTIFRPQALVGFALGSAMNMLSAIGAYAAISRELGVPLVWPGAGARYTEATDVRILARAMAWAGGAEAAANRPSTSPTVTSSSGRTFFPRGRSASAWRWARRMPCRWPC